MAASMVSKLSRYGPSSPVFAPVFIMAAPPDEFVPAGASLWRRIADSVNAP
jgi:hypothetical protein